MSRRKELDELLGPCPLSRAPFSERLSAHVCSADASRIHGYALQGDLARHYGASALLLLSLTGELPSAERVRAAEIALISSGGVGAGEGPAHATIAARVVGAERPALIGIAAVGLAEQAAERIAQAHELLAWLDEGATGAPPPAFTPEGKRAAALRADLEAEGIVIPALASGLSDEAALLATLHWAGLQRPEQLEAAWVTTRLPTVIAEALFHRPRKLLDYPMNLPRFVPVVPGDAP